MASVSNRTKVPTSSQQHFIHTTYVLLLAWLFKMQSVAHKQGSLFAPRFHATSKHAWTVLLLPFYRDALWLQARIHHVFLQHRGPRIKLMNNFAKGNLYVPCHETYPTCEMQSRCFKPLSVGGQVKDCAVRVKWCPILADHPQGQIRHPTFHLSVRQGPLARAGPCSSCCEWKTGASRDIPGWNCFMYS